MSDHRGVLLQAVAAMNWLTITTLVFLSIAIGALCLTMLYLTSASRVRRGASKTWWETAIRSPRD